VRCRRCRGPAVIEVRRHNAAFCRDCLVNHVREQVWRAISDQDMFARRDRILVAVSGGKDSLALWDVLLELGYRASGLYLGLGIGDYSIRSREMARAFAEGRNAELVMVDLLEEWGFDIPTAGKKGARSTCSVCGLSKRYVFNRIALERGYDVVATGHNLDDEAATLLGNTLRWQTEYIARQRPVLPAEPGFVKKVKPLYRLSELETAAYSFLRGIDYVVEECPLVTGNTQLRSSRLRRGRRPSSSSDTWNGQARCSRKPTARSLGRAGNADSRPPGASAHSAELGPRYGATKPRAALKGGHPERPFPAWGASAPDRRSRPPLPLPPAAG
jgi:tRNA(Ile)-lysidine synthase TilS/MesJ